ncbi:MAG: NAD(P)H-dependent oxidoreductase [Saprospiraceae bacterium]|nr:NAD(P)H-dependent oxidoreductase [Saprospiraceae bacterium]
MITVISGSNRKGSECLRFAQKYADLLRLNTEEEVSLVALENIAHDWFSPLMYKSGKQGKIITEIQDAYILPAEKFVFVIPEYNGGVPGSLKLFIDAISVRKYKENFKNKKAALIGVATGRAGNLRGLDHMADVLNHMGTVVFPNKQPISKIGDLTDDEMGVTDEATINLMEKHAISFIHF